MRSAFILVALVGLTTAATLVDKDKIVGGEEATPHEFPWQVSLRRKSDNFHFCGGSVLNENTVISAAHCTVIWDSPDQVVVVAGEHNQAVDEGTEQTVNVARLTVHESYQSGKAFENDIAIWSLAEPLVLNEYVAGVTLPTPGQESTGECTVTGWGTLSAGGSTPDVLMKVDVPVVSDGTCKLEYPFSIADSMLCAGEQGKDSCQGDSGGPLVCYNADKSGYLGGVVSWGRGCAGLWSPGVYTEVSYFVDWIMNNQ
jgi:trypsin